MNTTIERLLIVTGAGISAESGIPTFRGKDGYWRNLDPKALATETAFRKDPALVWQWYRERRALIRRSAPNAAHQATVALASATKEALVLTQNVDDLHARAEFHGQRMPPEKLVQIHGDIFVTRCLRCDFQRPANSDDESGVPLCPQCGSPLRPGVVWFDEELDPRELRRVENFLGAGGCDLVLVVGTTATFDYIVEWIRRGKQPGGAVIEINPERTTVSSLATEIISLPAAETLPGLLKRFSIV